MLRDFVEETASAPGTAATFNLAGALTGRVTFGSVFTSGALCFYYMDDGSQAEWGIGTFTSGAPNTLTRTTVLGNTAGTTARLNFTGTTRVYNEIPSARAIYADSNSRVTLPGDLVLNSVGGGQIGGFRNWLINGQMIFNQRGVSVAGGMPVSGGYSLDRWQVIYDGTGATHGVGQSTLANQSIQDLGLKQCASYSVTVAGSGNTVRQFRQPIESVFTGAGRTVTVSGYLWVQSGTQNVGVFLSQHFGSGGSPSADINTAAQTWAVTTTPTRFSATFNLPTVNGKVLGTNNDDTLIVVFTMPTGAATYQVNMTGMQFEIGPVVTPFEWRSIGTELELCLRFYQVQSQLQVAGYGNSSGGLVNIYPYNAMMRAAPTIALSSVVQTNANAQSVAYNNARLAAYQATVVSGPNFGAVSFTASMTAEFP